MRKLRTWLKWLGIIFVAVLVILLCSPLLLRGVVELSCLLHPALSYDVAQAQQLETEIRNQILQDNALASSPNNGWPDVADFFSLHPPPQAQAIQEGAELWEKMHPWKKTAVSFESLSSSIDKFVKDFEPVYQRIKQASSKKYFIRPRPFRGNWIDFTVELPNYMVLREFAKGLTVKAKWHLKRKEYDKALECYLLGFRLADSIEGHGLVQAMISAAMRNIEAESFLEDFSTSAAPAGLYKKALLYLNSNTHNNFLAAADEEYYEELGGYELFSNRISGQMPHFQKALRPYWQREKGYLEGFYLSIRPDLNFSTDFFNHWTTVEKKEKCLSLNINTTLIYILFRLFLRIILVQCSIMLLPKC